MHKTYYIVILILLLPWGTMAAEAIYNGMTVAVNNDYIRTEVGTTNEKIIKEVSGLACSRVTPGYLWTEKDEGTSGILALRPDGSRAMTLTFSGMNNRDDWEDICTGTYNGTPYIFIGAFGDNKAEYADNYYIVCVPEPAINVTATTATTATVAVTLIRFGFPDGAGHNVETLMYDPIEEVFYIVDKTDSGAPTLYHLAMRTDYGDALQRLEVGQKLGKKSDKWHNITAGDISPDGSLIAIKNKQIILLWTREGAESITTTLSRQPVQIGTYEEEEQGESIAWLDNNTFYTTSDSKGNTPIYIYSRTDSPAAQQELRISSPVEKRIINGTLYIRSHNGWVEISGRNVQTASF